MKRGKRKPKINTAKDVKSETCLGSFVLSARGLRKIADALEKNIGHDGDVEVNVYSCEYTKYNTIGLKIKETKK